MSYVKDGDNYPKECTKTTKLIMDKLGDIRYYQTYQSKFGPSEWLKPATDDTLKNYHQKVLKYINCCTRFCCRLSRNNRRIGTRKQKLFLENGGEVYKYVHPFNGDIEFAKLVKDIISL